MAARSTAQQDRIRRIGVLTALAESDPEGLPRAHFRQNSEKLFLLVFNATGQEVSRAARWKSALTP